MKRIKRTVALNGLVIRAFHGLYDFEKTKGGDFRLDISVSEEASAVAEEVSLEETVDYEKLLKIAVEEMEKTTDLLETVANRILLSVIGQFPASSEINVSIKKLKPPMEADIESSSVSVFYTAG